MTPSTEEVLVARQETAERWSSVTPSTADTPRSTRLDDEDEGGRPRSLIMDVCGAYMRPVQGWMPVSALVTLMDELGVGEQAVRSALSRLVRRELLVPERRERVRGYRLSDVALPRLDDADRRIFSHDEPARLEDGWVLVSFSLPEYERDKRHALRSRLAWLGFGNITGGLWMAPARVEQHLHDDVERMGLQKYVTVFRAEHRGFADLAELVRGCWDLEELRLMYDDFLERTEPVLADWRQIGRAAGVDAFVDYTVALYRWRKFPYQDPGLPAEVLPDGWAGARAREVFFELHELLAVPALTHVRAVVGRS